MRDVPNGTDLGLHYNGDNDPCRRIVDQKYQILVQEEHAEQSVLDSLRQRVQKLQELGHSPKFELKLNMVKEYSSPLECLEAVDRLEQSGFEVGINERKFEGTYGGSYWAELPKEELEKILSREREPVCRLVVPSNPHFSPYVDIGD